MKKTILFITTLFMALPICITHVYSQVQTKQVAIDSKKIIMLSEFGAILSEEDGKIVVKLKLGKKDVSTANELKQGDVILIVNGIRVKLMTEFKEIYESIESEKAVQIAVQRGDSRFLVEQSRGAANHSSSFSIENNQSAQLGEIKTFSRGANNKPQLTRTFPEGLERHNSLADLGLTLIEFKEEVVVIGKNEDKFPPEMKGRNSPLSHTLIKINDAKISSILELEEIYKNIEPEEEFDIYFSFQGNVKSYTIKKPAYDALIIERN